MINYHPVSNLSFLSNILEEAALEQITSHIEMTAMIFQQVKVPIEKEHWVENSND